MRLTTGVWATGILGAAAQHELFTHLDAGAGTPAELAAAASISERGAQALLDGLLGLGVIERDGERYLNGAAAAAFLVKGSPAYLGLMAANGLGELASWGDLGEVVRSGRSEVTLDVVENPFWEKLVTAIAPLSVPVAQVAAEKVGLAGAGPVSILDVGGGSGVYSGIWLGVNPEARSTQVDWANVNRVAREFVDGFGVGDRFETVDGDFHEVDWGEDAYDLAVFSHIAHQESPESNKELFARFRRALKPGGTLVISDFVLTDDRGGHPFALMFHANMLLHTPEGAAWREADYRTWLADAGVGAAALVAPPGPAPPVLAR